MADNKQLDPQRLSQLTLSEIEALPEDQREQAWEELARQISRQPGFDKSMKQLNEALTRAEEAVRAMSPMLEQAQEVMKKITQDATKDFSTFLSEDTLNVLKSLRTVAPYMELELKEHPDSYKEPGLPVSVLIANAARRARQDGKYVPMLRAEEPEQLQFDLNLPSEKEELRRKHIEEARRRHELAREEGAIISTDAKLATIAEKGLGFDYFTSTVIKELPGGIENFILDDNGRINLYALTGEDKAIEDVLRDVDGLHTAFLMWLLGLAWNNSDIRETNSGNAIIPVYLPAILDEMRIDPRPREWDKTTKQLKKRETTSSLSDLRRDKFMEFLRPLLNLAAFFGDDLYQIAGFYSYNADSETMYITAPYMFRLVEYAKLHATKHGAIKNIFHADIMTENQTAVEVANRIAMGLITRGVTRADAEADDTETTDKKITYKVRFSSLIADCPQLKKTLADIRNGQGSAEAQAIAEGLSEDGIAAARREDHKTDSQRINKKLQDTFTAAIRIITEKSDIPKYYNRLTIRTGKFPAFKAPTNSTLNEQLIIRHYGKNPDYTE